MIKQYNVDLGVFDDVSYTTKGDVLLQTGWYLVDNQESIDGISASITGGGVVWVDDGKLRWSGKAPSQYHQWQNGVWVLDVHKQAELKAQQQEQMRQAINTKRDQTDAGGVFVEALGKWVDSDEKAYQNILGVKASLDLLGDMDIPWTWADNTTSIINRTLLAAIVGALLQAKQQNHANALKHKEAMMAVDNPLDYDYSQGWSKTYADHLAEVGNE